MNIIEIMKSLNIDIIDHQLNFELEFYDIDFFNANTMLLPNVLYISENAQDLENITFIYPKHIKPKNHNYIIIDDNLNECFMTLHHYFINNHHMLLNIESFIKNMFSKNKSTVQQIVDESVKFLNNPIIVTNATYKVLGINNTGVYVDDPVFDNAFKYGYCNAESITSFEYEGVTRKVLTSNNAFLLNTGLAKKIPRILGKVEFNNKVIAYIGVLEVNRKLSKDDIEFVELICNVLQTVMSNNHELLDTTNIIYESIIKDTINGKIKNEFILQDRLKSSRWDLKNNFRCSIIKTSSRSIDNISYIVNTISYAFAIKVIIYQEDILILHEYNDHKKWHEQIDRVEKEARLLSLKVGVSNEFQSFLDLRKYYQEALDAVDIALQIKAKDTVFYFAAFLPYYMISKVDHYILNSLENTYYTRIQKYDHQHNTNYIETLYYYVLYNCNINQTANKLCIHRNTLTHRIERIEEISNIDINNGIMLQNFVLYYQMQYYLKKLNNSKS